MTIITNGGRQLGGMRWRATAALLAELPPKVAVYINKTSSMLNCTYVCTLWSCRV